MPQQHMFRAVLVCAILFLAPAAAHALNIELDPTKDKDYFVLTPDPDGNGAQYGIEKLDGATGPTQPTTDTALTITGAFSKTVSQPTEYSIFTRGPATASASGLVLVTQPATTSGSAAYTLAIRPSAGGMSFAANVVNDHGHADQAFYGAVVAHYAGHNAAGRVDIDYAGGAIDVNLVRSITSSDASLVAIPTIVSGLATLEGSIVWSGPSLTVTADLDVASTVGGQVSSGIVASGLFAESSLGAASITASGSITVAAAGSSAKSSNLATSGPRTIGINTLAATDATVTSAGDIRVSTGRSLAESSGDYALNGAAAFGLNAEAVTGAATITSTGAVTLTGGQATVKGASTFAGSSDVSIGLNAVASAGAASIVSSGPVSVTGLDRSATLDTGATITDYAAAGGSVYGLNASGHTAVSLASTGDIAVTSGRNTAVLTAGAGIAYASSPFVTGDRVAGLHASSSTGPAVLTSAGNITVHLGARSAAHNGNGMSQLLISSYGAFASSDSPGGHTVALTSVGDICLTGETLAATSSAEAAVSSAILAGLFASNDAATATIDSTGGITVNSPAVHATSGGSRAEARNLSTGIESPNVVTRGGAIMVTAEAQATTNSGIQQAVATTIATGVLALSTAAIANESITVSAAAAATNTDVGGAEHLGYAFGVETGEDITLANTVRSVTASGQTHAFALSAGTVVNDSFQDGPHRTTLYGPTALFASTLDAGSNVTPNSNQSVALPVAAAEYLGLGGDDTLNLDPGAASDNNGRALRVFGAETVNILSGSVRLAEGSYFINQKEFYISDPLVVGDDVNHGNVIGPARHTDVNIAANGVLRLDGRLQDTLTAADSVHTTKFTTAGAFTLDEDYTLALNVKSGGKLQVQTNGGMRMTTLGAASGSTLAFALDGPAAAPALEATSAATIAGTFEAYSPLEDGLDVAAGVASSRAVLYSPNLDIAAARFGSQLLLYDYSFREEAGVLYLDAVRNAKTVSSAVRDAGGTRAASLIADNLARYTDTDPGILAIREAFNETSGGDAARSAAAANQLAGATGSFAAVAGAVTAGMFSSLLDTGLTSADPSSSQAGLVVSSPDAMASPYCDAPAPWRLRLQGSISKGKLDGGDGFADYRIRNRAGLMAFERHQGGLTLGFAGAWGATRATASRYSDKSRSTEYGLFAYGRYDAVNGMFVAARAGYTYSDVDYNRHLPAFRTKAKGDFAVDYFSAALTVGRHFDLGGGWLLSPSGGISYLATRGDSYTERGAGLYNLHYSGVSQDSFEGKAALALSRRVVTAAAVITPRAAAGLSYEFADRQATSQGAFAVAPTFPRFDSQSRRVGRARGLFELGVDFELNNRIAIGLDYRLTVRSNYIDHTGGINFGLSW